MTDTMAERSKAQRSGRCPLGGVGSNPTRVAFAVSKNDARIPTARVSRGPFLSVRSQSGLFISLSSTTAWRCVNAVSVGEGGGGAALSPPQVWTVLRYGPFSPPQCRRRPFVLRRVWDFVRALTLVTYIRGAPLVDHPATTVFL